MSGAQREQSVSISEAIKEDHGEIMEDYNQYNRAAGDVDTQKRWARQFTWEVARHSVGEEIVVYPLFEKVLGAQGKKMADHDRAEHQVIKELLAKMENMTVGTDEYNQTLHQVMDNLKKHITSEENEDLPALESKLNELESRDVARSFQRTKKFVPTRPHPSAPDRPPYETLAGFIAMPIDKLKDLFSKFPSESK